MAGRVPSLPTVDGKLAAGVYESLHTAGLDRQLADATGLTPRFSLVDAADAPEVLARHIASIVRRVLADERNHDRRSTLVNELLTVLAAAEEQPTETLEQILVLTREVAPGVHELLRPQTPSSSSETRGLRYHPSRPSPSSGCRQRYPRTP